MNITLQQSVLILVWGSFHSSMSTHEQLSHLKNQTKLITHDLEKMILFMLNEQS